MSFDRQRSSNFLRNDADLECLLSCRSLSSLMVQRILDVCTYYEFHLTEGGSLLLYAEDPVVPARILNRNDFSREDLADLLRNTSICILNLRGFLESVATSLALYFDFSSAVLVVSVPGNLLARYESAEVGRACLLRFGAICRHIGAEVAAERALVGLEPCHSDEMRLELACAAGAMPTVEALSEEKLLKLLEPTR